MVKERHEHVTAIAANNHIFHFRVIGQTIKRQMAFYKSSAWNAFQKGSQIFSGDGKKARIRPWGNFLKTRHRVTFTMQHFMQNLLRPGSTRFIGSCQNDIAGAGFVLIPTGGI